MSKKPYLPSQFQYILDACSTHEQKQTLIEIRQLIIANHTIQERYNTRHLTYCQQDNPPCIEIIFAQEWPNPKVFFTLFHLTKNYQWGEGKCRYASSINNKGEFSRRLSLYQLNSMTFNQTYRQLDKVLETFLETKVEHLPISIKLQNLIELAILS
ncbi:MAG: hypothetical protein AB4058_06730 [Microcystaceae cyanobacterium]